MDCSTVDLIPVSVEERKKKPNSDITINEYSGSHATVRHRIYSVYILYSSVTIIAIIRLNSYRLLRSRIK